VQVEIRLFATLASFLPPGSRDGVGVVELEPGATVQRLIERLAIPAEISRIVLVNGQDVEDDARLQHGDVVDVFPPLAGGGAPSARW
jgi:molybdopterin converting factor small subunit